jgi:hypothetical protein
MLSPRSSTSKKLVQKQPEIDSAKLDNFYIATIDDLGFKNTVEKEKFDCFFKEYVEETIKRLGALTEKLKRGEETDDFIMMNYLNQMAQILVRRIDI